MEIILCPYDLGAYVRQMNERARQRELAKNAQANPVLFTQEALDKIINDPDLLKGVENHIPNIIKTIGIHVKRT